MISCIARAHACAIQQEEPQWAAPQLVLICATDHFSHFSQRLCLSWWVCKSNGANIRYDTWRQAAICCPRLRNRARRSRNRSDSIWLSRLIRSDLNKFLRLGPGLLSRFAEPYLSLLSALSRHQHQVWPPLVLVLARRNAVKNRSISRPRAPHCRANNICGFISAHFTSPIISPVPMITNQPVNTRPHTHTHLQLHLNYRQAEHEPRPAALEAPSDTRTRLDRTGLDWKGQAGSI